MSLSLPSIVLEVSTHVDATLTPTARDKLDLQVAKQNVNLCRATVAGAATARYRTPGLRAGRPVGRWLRWSPRSCAAPASGVRFPGRISRVRGGSDDHFCGYRWTTMQVRVRVTPSTAWMREATSRPS